MSMHYHTYPPSSTLRDYVRCYWVLESDAPYTHHAMADVSAEMIFHYTGRFDDVLPDGRRSPSFLAGLSGPSSQVRQASIGRGFGIFGVYLYPQALAPFFGITAEALVDEMPDLVALLGQTGRILGSRVLSADSNRERMLILEQFFLSRLPDLPALPPPVFAAMQHLMRLSGPQKIGALAEQCGLSERQLERQFRRYAGFSPKQFQRIARFHRAMTHYGRTEQNLAQIALDCGYYDQAHFCADFKQFSGLKPGEFFSRESEATLWRDSMTNDQ